MSKYLNSARRYHEAIRNVLFHDWDPIGGSHIPEDEDDSYRQGIHALLIQNESRVRLLDHLWWIETTSMGLYGNRANTAQAVQS